MLPCLDVVIVLHLLKKLKVGTPLSEVDGKPSCRKIKLKLNFFSGRVELPAVHMNFTRTPPANSAQQRATRK